MIFKYWKVNNFGEGFITKVDNYNMKILFSFKDIYVTYNDDYSNQWADRVNAINITKEEAQNIVDLEIKKQQDDFDSIPENDRINEQRPEKINLI
jgi:hypothetical protein